MKLSCGFGFGNLKQIDFLQLARLHGRSGQSPASTPATLAQLTITARQETTHHLRDGEVVLYLRPGSRVWQVRYKLFDRKWHCETTHSIGSVGNFGGITLLTKKCFCLATGFTAVHLVSNSFLGFRGFIVFVVC